MKLRGRFMHRYHQSPLLTNRCRLLPLPTKLALILLGLFAVCTIVSNVLLPAGRLFELSVELARKRPSSNPSSRPHHLSFSEWHRRLFDGAWLLDDGNARTTVPRETPQPYYLTSSIEMEDLEKQRLKPWHRSVVFGSSLCQPQPSETLSTLSKRPGYELSVNENATSDANHHQHITWDRWIARAPVPDICPRFSSCNGGSLDEVKFCRHPLLYVMDISAIKPPRKLSDRRIANYLSYDPFTLPWTPDIVAVEQGVFINYFGHVFNENRHYLHGGCQDEVDSLHGGPQSYRWNDSNLRVVRFRQAINLVHIYGSNYYHFTIEVLPRVLMMLPIIRQYPHLPILIRKTPHLHLLRLFNMRPEDFYFYPIDSEKELVYVSESAYIPLASRCLHAPKQVWATIRGLWKKYLPSWIPESTISQLHNAEYNFVSSLTKNTETVLVRRIIYMSRLDAAPRRHVENENDLIRSIVDSLGNLSSAHGMVQEPGISHPIYTFYSAKSGENASPTMISLIVLYGNESLPITYALTSKAQLMIGPHGAGLSNMIMMPRRSFVLELRGDGYWNPCFTYLSNAIDTQLFEHKIGKGQEEQSLRLNQSDHELVFRWISERFNLHSP